MLINVQNEAELQRFVAQIAYRVSQEVIHTFLSEMGIQRLEAILKKAEENRRTIGHNGYTTLAAVWLQERKRTMTRDTSIAITNPYREGSKMHRIFQFMADGVPHTLGDIVTAAYAPSDSRATPLSCANSLCRRRVSSALRTIRGREGLFVTYNYIGGVYRLRSTS